MISAKAEAEAKKDLRTVILEQYKKLKKPEITAESGSLLRQKTDKKNKEREDAEPLKASASGKVKED